MAAAIFLISTDDIWARRVAGLCEDEGLGASVYFRGGKSALSAYRERLPDIAVFDLRKDPRDITVALAMVREIYPRMANGGVCIIGNADPANREAVRIEREQLQSVKLAEYLPGDISDAMLANRFHALMQRARERESQKSTGLSRPRPVIVKVSSGGEAAAGSPDPEVSVRVEQSSEQVPWRLSILMKPTPLRDQLMEQLADLGPEVLNLGREIPRELPDHLLVDASTISQVSEKISAIRERHPRLRVMQLPEVDGAGMRRLNRNVNALLNLESNDLQADWLAGRVRSWVEGDNEFNTRPLILLVEDEQNIRELTAHYLLLQGFEVHQAEDGMEAVGLFKMREPDLVLSDIYMPRMNGFKLLLEVKNLSPWLPVLMVTGYNSAAQVLSSTKYQNVSFLPKPFRLSELGEKIRAMLGASHD
jgi:CheY-like chemotaxis protein